MLLAGERQGRAVTLATSPALAGWLAGWWLVAAKRAVPEEKRHQQ
jgi:hypothetical protein